MSDEFKNDVEKIVKEIKKEVYIKDEVLQKIVALFLSIKKGLFPGNKPPRGLLFYGPPGTGKTQLMKVLAKNLELSEPIIIRGPEIISQYYGKSEERLRKVFLEAKEKAEEETLAIIFIDEIDSLAPRRDLSKGELEQRLVGQLLSLMDGLERENLKSEKVKEESKNHVIVIGSTNRPEALDPALRRPGRFDLEIEFDPPNVDERKEILRILWEKNIRDKNKYNIDNIDLDKIAEQTRGFTGADLLQLLNEGLLQSIIEGRNYITQEDLLRVVNSIKPSALREFNLEKPKNRIEDIKKEIGEHEANTLNQKLNQIVDDFCNKPRFTPILISLENNNDKVASTIAYLINEKLKYPYLVVDALRFRSKWFGEMERSIRELFEKIKRLQQCVVYIKYLDAIADKNDEHLQGANLELLKYLWEFNDMKDQLKVLLLCSIEKDNENINKNIISIFGNRHLKNP